MRTLYSWGANSHGQLGLGFDSELCGTPQRLEHLPFGLGEVKSIQGGGGHVLILDSQGSIYSCGWNHKGQLGNNATTDLSKFTRISTSLRFQEIACGWDSSAAIDVDGNLHVWGSNAFEQLGLSKKQLPFVKSAMRLDLPNREKVRRCSFGLRFICILTESNAVYFAGRIKFSDRCECISHNEVDFHRLILREEIDQISSGQNHVVCATQDRIIGFGDNKFRQSDSFNIQHSVKFLKSGWTHNAILTGDCERVLLWGRNTYGQLGSVDSKSTSLRPLGLKATIVALHLGSEHGLVITVDGEVFTWGWNEHGNCGNGSEENVYQPEKVPLNGKCTIAGAGAGFCYALVES